EICIHVCFIRELSTCRTERRVCKSMVVGRHLFRMYSSQPTRVARSFQLCLPVNRPASYTHFLCRVSVRPKSERHLRTHSCIGEKNPGRRGIFTATKRIF